jgi:hypothetical protein
MVNAKYFWNSTGMIPDKTIVSNPDPDWIRIQSGQWIRILIQNPEGRNDPQK